MSVDVARGDVVGVACGQGRRDASSRDPSIHPRLPPAAEPSCLGRFAQTLWKAVRSTSGGGSRAVHVQTLHLGGIRFTTGEQKTAANKHCSHLTTSFHCLALTHQTLSPSTNIFLAVLSASSRPLRSAVCMWLLLPQYCSARNHLIA